MRRPKEKNLHELASSQMVRSVLGERGDVSGVWKSESDSSVAS
jgi:hypothetical protein